MHRPQHQNRRPQHGGANNYRAQHQHQQQLKQQHKQPAYRAWDTCINTDIDEADPPTAPTADDNNAPHQDVTIMSYNVLAQHLIASHPDLYARHQPHHLHWPHRLSRLVATIRQAQPTILCLQEVQDCHLTEFAHALSTVAHLDGHVYQRRTATTTHDGCAIFYRSDCVQLMRAHSVEYEQPSEDNDCRAPLLDRPNIALLAHFHAVGRPALRLQVATTHLLFNPKREDVRLAQMQLLLAELDRCAWLGKCPDGSGRDVYAPIVLTGDLNAAPHSATVQLLTHGTVAYGQRLGSRLLDQQSAVAAQKRTGAKPGAYGAQLLPVQMGITDECQHAGVVWSRGAGGMEAHRHVEDMSATWLHHSQENSLIDSQSAAETAAMRATGLPFQTGRLCHRFGLRSVYSDGSAVSRIRPQPLTATTFHDDWLTVDYILYSRPWCERRRRPVEGSALRLLSRWRLPSVGECQQRLGCMPNAEHGSDHVALAAMFRLGASQWVDG